MNIWTKQYELCREKCSISTQLTIDDDYIVKDTKPDVIQVIYGRGEALLEEVRVNKDTVWIMGKLQFEVLYCSDAEGGGIESISSDVPFQEKLNMDGVDENDKVQVRLKLEDISIGVINSRKLSVRALLGVEAKSSMNTELILSEDTDEDVEKLLACENILVPVCELNQKERLSCKLELPSSKPNIGKILLYMPMLHITEQFIENRRVVLRGSLKVGVLYESQSEGVTEWTEYVEPIVYEWERDEIEDTDILWLESSLEETNAKLVEDIDGEDRVIQIDYTVITQGLVYREQQVSYLKDLYSLNRNLKLYQSVCEGYSFCMKNLAKSRVCQQLQLDKIRPKMLSVCTYIGRIDEYGVKKETGGLTIEGILSTEVVYMTSQDQMPLAASSGQVEFRQFVEVKDMRPDTEYKVQVMLESLQMNLMDQNSYEILASIGIAVLAYSPVQLVNISGIEEVENEQNITEPGMVGYVVTKEESLWDIAKNNHCTVDNIRELNELETDSVMPGEKLLIAKFYK